MENFSCYLEEFKSKGVVVIPSIISAEEIAEARHGLASTLLNLGVIKNMKYEISAHLIIV